MGLRNARRTGGERRPDGARPRRWYLPAAAAAAAAVALDAIGRHSLTHPGQWVQPLAVLLLVPLIGRKRPTPSRRLIALLLPFVVLLQLPLFGPGFAWAPFLLVFALALPVTMLDHRVGLALALIGMLGVTDAGLTMQSFFWDFHDMARAMWLPALWPAAVLGLGGVLARRRARI